MNIAKAIANKGLTNAKKRLALTLVEVILSLALASLTAAAIVDGYITGARMTETASEDAAAQAMALNTLERVRSAKWDRRAHPQIDQVIQINFPPTREVFNLPTKLTTPPTGTNFIYIREISTDPPVRLIRASCVWRSSSGKLKTNSVSTYRGPDQ